MEMKMNRIRVYPYKAGSRSAKVLADKLGGKVLKKVGSKYNYREGDLVINWGASDCPFSGRGVANQPNAIEPASNKLKYFLLMKEAGVSHPEFWTRREDIPADAYPVMCRTKLQGHSAEGLVIANDANGLVAAPLYTRYIKKQEEYRVHLIRKPDGQMIDVVVIQRKAKRLDAVEPNFMIRNLANGFVYVLDDEDEVPACVVEESKKALEATALAFGAVDVIYNRHQDKAYILEVNTAPGLEDRTAEAYAEAFQEIIKNNA